MPEQNPAWRSSVAGFYVSFFLVVESHPLGHWEVGHLVSVGLGPRNLGEQGDY